jgi:hypothetical protein
MNLLIAVLTIIVILLVCYVLLIVVERLFGPIDPVIKSVIGVIVLILVILYLMGHIPVGLPRW